MSEPTPALPTSTAEYYRPMPVYLAPRPTQRYWLHGILLLATVFTTLVVGAHFQYNYSHQLSALAQADDSDAPLFPIDVIAHHPARLLQGIPFSASLMLILLAHEMGHYLACVYYNVDATLPFFIPFPSLIGTMGAFIRIRSPIRSRRALFDIGIAGPIAGFVVACAVLAVGLGLSRVAPPAASQTQFLQVHYPLIFPLMRGIMSSMGFLQGTTALPMRGLVLHPLAIAAWAGMFATSLNLLPGGQLDGGHIVFSIAPRAHRLISRITILILIPMAVYLWWVWLLWAILLEISSFRHPQVNEWPRVSGKRVALAVFAMLMLVLTLHPQPISVVDNGRDQSSLKAVVQGGRQEYQKWRRGTK